MIFIILHYEIYVFIVYNLCLKKHRNLYFCQLQRIFSVNDDFILKTKRQPEIKYHKITIFHYFIFDMNALLIFYQKT